MTGLLARLTVKPLLWACGLQLAAIVALSGVLWVQDTWHQGRLSDMTAQRDRAQVAFEAWRIRAHELDAANFAHQSVNNTLRRLLSEAQGEATRLQAEGQAAVVAAEAAKDEADRTLATWMRKYADQVQTSDCASALAAVERACPAFGGY